VYGSRDCLCRKGIDYGKASRGLYIYISRQIKGLTMPQGHGPYRASRAAVRASRAYDQIKRTDYALGAFIM